MNTIFGGNISLINADAIATIVFPDMESLAAFFADPAQTELAHDGVNFMIPEKAHMITGSFKVFIDNGEVQRE